MYLKNLIMVFFAEIVKSTVDKKANSAAFSLVV